MDKGIDQAFFELSSKQMIFLASSLSVMLTEKLSTDRQNVLGNFLMCVGQNILINATQEDALTNALKSNDKPKKN